MSRRHSQQAARVDDKEGSSWSWLGKAWLLGYLLPVLIGLAVTLHQQGEKRAEEDRKRQQQLNKQIEGVKEQMRERVLEGSATDVDLILLGIERDEYEKYKRHLAVKKDKRENN